MVQLIVGSKGDGKTKHLLDRVNNQIKTASGNIVYLDKNTKHMHELDNKVRLMANASCCLWQLLHYNKQNLVCQAVMDLSDLSVALFHRITIWSRCIWTAF